MQNEEVVLNLDLNVKEADEKIDDIVQTIKEIGVLVGNLGVNLVKGFAAVEKSAKNMEISIAAVSDTMNQLVQHVNSLVALCGELQLGEGLNELTVASSICTIIQTIIALMDDLLVEKLKNMAADIPIIALYAVDYVKSFGSMIAQLVASAAAWVRNTAVTVANTAASWAQIAATTAWKVLCIAATAVTTAFGAAMTFLTSPIGLVVVAITALIAIVVLLVQNWDTVKATVLNVWEAIKNALGTAWQWLKSTLLDPLVNGFKSVINGIIGFINGMIAGAVKGINGLVNMLNKLQFSVPDWVPGLGGMTLGFDLKPVTAPQIPYLAQGAVLPANRPFLAVVGDQRHGTNVEAPLETIQEAVAVVIDDYVNAMMAGFEALLAEQRATRQAVESIHIGDDALYKAVQRRSRVMSIARGGL